ncbi:TauD-domain-containing protein [Nadsonia fulvescens var. elongata DSM 6958]|uniref:TauD-domain-containing protein n=1 Tax=Nadsonia fulvescens var. elongata DSM 6958 TaxID=857566 RepID=A0A1E3PNS2_9ASCO|nr:TauD-domain-containing protein [Nadsonia fulvescens var. elongata DSM 6958]
MSIPDQEYAKVIENLKIKGNSFVEQELDIQEGQALNFEEYIQKPRFAKIKNKKYVPVWNRKDKYEPLTEFQHVDRGHFADPSFKSLLSKKAGTQDYIDGVQVRNLTPKFGTEINGVQLSALDDAGKDELALYVAQRGVVVFRNQDLKDKRIEQVEALSNYFGRPHIHPTSPTVVGHPEVFLVYHENSPESAVSGIASRSTSTLTWHSDVSYEKQPAGTTFLAYLQGPSVGGDTLYADTQEAYERLSPEFCKRLEGLEATHSGVEQVNGALARGGVVRRAPTVSTHPVVRTHPVTKRHSIYVNPGFTRAIVGYKKEESDALLKFLYDHITKSGDLQIRASWEEGTIVVWDNRRAVHTATYDFDDVLTRHAFRITPQAEKPSEK